jgi:hypothetical protein
MERAEHAEPLNASGMVAAHSGGGVAPHDADEALEMSGSSPRVGDQDEPDFLWRTNGECNASRVWTRARFSLTHRRCENLTFSSSSGPWRIFGASPIGVKRKSEPQALEARPKFLRTLARSIRASDAESSGFEVKV